MQNVKKTDSEIYEVIKHETHRQETEILASDSFESVKSFVKTHLKG